MCRDRLDNISGILEKLDCLVHLAFYADDQRLMSIVFVMIGDYVRQLRETVSHLQEENPQ
jgi:hypothetical protein